MLQVPFNSSAFNSTAFGPGDVAAFNEVFLFVALILVLLQLRTRRVRWWTMVIAPALMLLVTLGVVSTELNSGIINLLTISAGFAIGIGAGAVIASRMKVRIAPDGVMILQGSLLMVVLWMAIIALKLYGKSLIGGLGLVDFDVLTSALLAMTLGTMIGRRIFVYMKYLRLKEKQ